MMTKFKNIEKEIKINSKRNDNAGYTEAAAAAGGGVGVGGGCCIDIARHSLRHLSESSAPDDDDDTSASSSTTVDDGDGDGDDDPTDSAASSYSTIGLPLSFSSMLASLIAILEFVFD